MGLKELYGLSFQIFNLRWLDQSASKGPFSIVIPGKGNLAIPMVENCEEKPIKAKLHLYASESSSVSDY